MYENFMTFSLELFEDVVLNLQWLHKSRAVFEMTGHSTYWPLDFGLHLVGVWHCSKASSWKIELMLETTTFHYVQHLWGWTVLCKFVLCFLSRLSYFSFYRGCHGLQKTHTHSDAKVRNNARKLWTQNFRCCLALFSFCFSLHYRASHSHNVEIELHNKSLASDALMIACAWNIQN